MTTVWLYDRRDPVEPASATLMRPVRQLTRLVGAGEQGARNWAHPRRWAQPAKHGISDTAPRSRSWIAHPDNFASQSSRCSES